MNYLLRRALAAVAIAATASIARAAPAQVESQAHTVAPLPGAAVRVTSPGSITVDYRPRFVVLRSATDPKLATRPGQIGKVSYSVATWLARRGETAAGLKQVDTTVTAGDGHDTRILAGDTDGRTADVFAAADLTEWIATGRRKIEDGFEWELPERPFGRLFARLRVPATGGPPALSVEFTANEPGFYSIAFAGSPEHDPADTDETWQPLIWQGKRFPDKSYLTLAYRCTLPAPMVTRAGVTQSVVAAPAELPFQPLPLAANSGFGVAVRNERGLAQPLVFAPALGGPGSSMRAGDTHRFTTLLQASRGDTRAAFERIAREVYGFRNYRTNASGSLNDTLERIVAYGMSKFANFNEELRGCSYATDVPGAVKNVSSLHPFSVALVMDDPEVYEQRARSIIEYQLSREKFLFAVSPDVKIQNPSWRLRGPCAPVSELAALDALTGGANPYLGRLAEELLNRDRKLNLLTNSRARRWDKLLAVYQATGKPALLDEAVERARQYLERDPIETDPDFTRQSVAFWNHLVPPFPELLELYEASGDGAFLTAAHKAARAYAQYVWMCPKIPEGSVVVNPGGKAPHYWYMRSKGKPQMRVPEEAAPAWRLSEVGLTPEGPPTSTGHRGVFMANHAPWMLRIGHLTGDRFLIDLARSAIVGRYANFPGYHMNTGRTTVYEAADYPLRDHNELSYNSFHYNHIWPHAALLIDYLVSDAFAKSDGAVEFPSRFAEGYAYLKNNVYGDRPGRFYADNDVWLWMPAGLVEIDNPQLNYLSARKNDTLYLAFCNQAFEPQRATVRLTRSLAQVTSASSVRMLSDDSSVNAPPVEQDAITIDVPAQGLVALAIDGVAMPARRLVPAAGREPRNGGDAAQMVQMPFAEQTTGFLIDALGQRSAYVYLQATFETIDSATLHYKVEGEGDWESVEDIRYPFEYTIPLPDDSLGVRFYVESRSPEGVVDRSEEALLGSSK